MTLPVPELISISEILCDDRYRVSRRTGTDSLEHSLRNVGMLEIPVLVRSNAGLIPFTCHNRIDALKRIGVTELNAVVTDDPDYAIFSGNTALKAYRDELGPAGRAKALFMAAEYFGITDLKSFCRNILNTSGELLTPGFVHSFLNLPGVLVEYIDTRDIGFRVIKDIINLPDYMVNALSQWTASIQIRVNIFKMLVDCLFDMKNTVSRDMLPVITDEDKPDDKSLFDRIYRMRFPDYSGRKDELKELVSAVSFPGFSVEFPEFFERDTCIVRLEVRSSDSPKDIRSRLARIDIGGLERLVSLLR